MTSLADSDAVHDIRRILPQHQSALTLLNGKLQNPAVKSLRWLDLACGKGQIIAQLSENLSAKQRKKLSYVGYDINVEHTRTAERMADSLALATYEFLHGDMSSFTDIVKADSRFDFITCTNTAHELQPGAFAALLLEGKGDKSHYWLGRMLVVRRSRTQSSPQPGRRDARRHRGRHRVLSRWIARGGRAAGIFFVTGARP